MLIWSEFPLPGFFQGFFAESKGLVSVSFWLPSLLNLRHSVVSWVVNDPSTALQCCKTRRYGPYWGSSVGISLTRSLLVHVFSRFGGRCSLGHFGSGFLVCSLHASGRCDKKMTLKLVPSLCVRGIPELCNCNKPKECNVTGFYQFLDIKQPKFRWIFRH